MTESIRVLHVDDEPDFADMAATYLEHENDRFEVDVVASASEGIDRLHGVGDVIDCVVSDYDMPDQNGLEFLETVREEYPDLPFILYTGKGSEEVASHAISAGVTDYLQKESGTDQYTLLANRIQNAVSAYRSKHEAKRRQHRFEQTLKTVPACVVQINYEGQFVFANDRAEEVLGLEPEDVPERSYNDPEWKITDLAGNPIPDEELPFRLVRDSGEPVYGYRHTIEWPDGTTKTLLVNGAPLFDDEGNVESTLFALTDITERARREEQLQHHRSQFEALLETSIDGILVIDENREYVTWNQRFIEMWGVPEDLIGEEPEDHALDWAMKHLEKPDEFIEKVEHLYDHPKEESRDEIRMKNGQVFDRYSAPVQRDDGTFYGRVWFFRDITDQKEHLRELERERDRFEAIFETIPEPSVHVVFEESDPIIQRCNQAFEEVFGYSTDEVTGKFIDVLLAPNDREADAEAINRSLMESEVIQTEVYRETQDGERPFLFTAKTMDLGEGSDERIEGIGTYVDLSDQKRREAELLKQNERLDDFASIVSHDLRNPLSVATGRLELAREETDSEHLDSVARALDRIDRIIEDVLWLARKGRDIDDSEAVDLAQAFDKAMEMVADETTTYSADIEIHKTDGLGEIPADYDRLCRMFENLLRNSVEHGHEDVQITLGALEDGFYVEDNGPGIPEVDRENVFEAGYSTSAEGTGFGLAIVRQVAEAHGWEIRVTEGTEGGARFEFVGIGTTIY